VEKDSPNLINGLNTDETGWKTVALRSLISLCFILWALTVSAWAGETTFEWDRLSIQTGQESIEFSVEMAETPRQRAQGLMFRRQLAEGTGMLFNFKRSMVIRMWMKSTYIPLDMLFIDEGGTIFNIVHNTKPHSTEIISSGGKALAVLEIEGGEASRLGIKSGDRVKHSLFLTKSQK